MLILLEQQVESSNKNIIKDERADRELDTSKAGKKYLQSPNLAMK